MSHATYIARGIQTHRLDSGRSKDAAVLDQGTRGDRRTPEEAAGRGGAGHAPLQALACGRPPLQRTADPGRVSFLASRLFPRTGRRGHPGSLQQKDTKNACGDPGNVPTALGALSTSLIGEHYGRSEETAPAKGRMGRGRRLRFPRTHSRRNRVRGDEALACPCGEGVASGTRTLSNRVSPPSRIQPIARRQNGSSRPFRVGRPHDPMSVTDRSAPGGCGSVRRRCHVSHLMDESGPQASAARASMGGATIRSSELDEPE